MAQPECDDYRRNICSNFWSAYCVSPHISFPILYPVRLLATIYTDIFRSLPLLLVLFLVGLGVPGLPISWITNSAVVLGTVSLILTYSAYVAEVIRAGIEAVNPA